MRLSVFLVFLFGSMWLAGPAQADYEVIDFADLPAGTVVSELYGSAGTGPILVHGLNPRFGPDTNTAVVFDSANPTGQDPDLGAPNETFQVDGEPGPGRGDAGVKGAEYENSSGQGKLLIIAEDMVDADGDGLIDDPDDMDHRGNLYSFDFTSVGPITIDSLTLIDVERNEGPAMAKLFDADGAEIRVFDLPATGDNGLAKIDFEGVSGVAKMTVALGGSGAISGFRFEPESPPPPPPIVITELPQTAGSQPTVVLIALLLIAVGVVLRAVRA